MTLIIPYTAEELTWHLRANVYPKLNENTIEKIVDQCVLVNMGEMSLDDEIVNGSGITVAEMLCDLKIDYNN